MVDFHRKKCRKPKEAWARWGLLLLVGATLLATAEAQTFQYSRGWTNGKRSGGYGVGGPYDLGTGEGMLGVDPLEVIIPPGHLQMSLNPQSRYRAGEYTQVSETSISLLIDPKKAAQLLYQTHSIMSLPT